MSHPYVLFIVQHRGNTIGGDYIQRYVIDYTLKNGLGKPAISLYLTGCDKPVKCKGCHNWELISESENDYDIEQIKTELAKQIDSFLEFHKDLHVSILGGEPLASYNRDITLEVSKFVKSKYSNSTITLYSWREKELLKTKSLNRYIKHIDYGVLGGWEEDLFIKDTLPASTNQYIYDFKNNKKLKPIKIR